MQLSEAVVLVVDDEPLLNLTMTLLLQRTGATVLQAANGVEALQLVVANAIDVMVCDENMPVMDGHTLLHRLHNAGRSLPTLLFGSGPGAADEQALRALGVRRSLTKPIQPRVLIGMIEAVLADVPSR